MEIHGKKYTTRQLRSRMGRMDQTAGIRLVQLDDGRGRPARAALFHTGSGLEFTVMIDRCLDISAASFQGRAMGWRSTVGDVAPQYYEAECGRWLRSYFGGLLTTCGLMNVGAPPEDSVSSGVGVHGRIGNTPAEDLKVTQEWRGNDYVLEASGTMREAVLFGENLSLTRTVSTKLGERRLWVHDVVANEGFNTEKFQLLYHCNIGWPALDEGSELICPSKAVAPRDEEAAKGEEQWAQMESPTHNYAEKVYYHHMRARRDGTVTVALLNSQFKAGNGFGVYVKYAQQHLPRFTQWKMMGEQDYVLGLEPCNCGVEGRAVDDQQGLLHALKPGESRSYDLEFGPVTTKAEAKAIRKNAGDCQTRFATHYSEFVKKPGRE